MTIELNARIPAGPLAETWDRHRFEMKLVTPARARVGESEGRSPSAQT